MVDTFAPLDLGEGGLAAEDPAYAWTWAGRGPDAERRGRRPGGVLQLVNGPRCAVTSVGPTWTTSSPARRSPLGGSLFAAGAFLAQTGAELLAVNVTYLIGGFFFSLGGWLSILQTPTGSRARSSAFVLFVGTLLFAVSLVAAFASGLTPAPDQHVDLVPGHRSAASASCCPGTWPCWTSATGGSGSCPEARDWWIVVVNQVGSVLFLLAGLGRVRPAGDLGAGQRRPGQLGDVLRRRLLRDRGDDPDAQSVAARVRVPRQDEDA